MCPALADGFLTSGPPGKPRTETLNVLCLFFLSVCLKFISQKYFLGCAAQPVGS